MSANHRPWPSLRGKLIAQAPLAPLTWLRVGGPARALFQPEDRADLQTLLRADTGLPVVPLGVGSNLLVRDGGVEAVVVRLRGPLAEVRIEGDVVIAGAGATDRQVAGQAWRAGLSGLEFFVGIPGSIGGAVRMNAGAYGGETADRLIWAELLTGQGALIRLNREELGLAYRHSQVPEDAIVTAAAFQATPGEPATIRAEMAHIRATREASQPLHVATGGSTFKNPPGVKAWQLIDAAGCRGLRVGRAEMSAQHCNFMINTGGATAAELERLGESVRARVLAQSGISLDWEIKRWGVPVPSAAEDAA